MYHFGKKTNDRWKKKRKKKKKKKYVDFWNKILDVKYILNDTLSEADLMQPIFWAIMADVYQTPGAAAPVEGKIKIFYIIKATWGGKWS